jgi:hypothetical protein
MAGSGAAWQAAASRLQANLKWTGVSARGNGAQHGIRASSQTRRIYDLSPQRSLLRRIAAALSVYASNMLPPERSVWGRAMKNELEHIEDDLQALTWAAGCVLAVYIERGGRKMDEPIRSFGAIVRKPSAMVPLAMSVIALAMLGGAYIFGLAMGHGGLVREPDEGALAHLWQLLMAGQLPVLAFFAIKWLPLAPKQTLYVLALQAGAVLAAMAPVYFLPL